MFAVGWLDELEKSHWSLQRDDQTGLRKRREILIRKCETLHREVELQMILSLPMNVVPFQRVRLKVNDFHLLFSYFLLVSSNPPKYCDFKPFLLYLARNSAQILSLFLILSHHTFCPLTRPASCCTASCIAGNPLVHRPTCITDIVHVCVF